MKPNNTIPYYFDETEITEIFNKCNNIKHLAILKTMFYASLRASKVCNLDDSDVDLKALTIYVRGGKGGKDALVFITDDCAKTLRRYLDVRAPLVIDKRKPLFYTDFSGSSLFSMGSGLSLYSNSYQKISRVNLPGSPI
jgi:integrase